MDIASIPGASVAGDFGAGIIAFLVCKIRSDIDLVLPYTKTCREDMRLLIDTVVRCCIQSVQAVTKILTNFAASFSANWKQVLICQRRSARFGVLLPK